MRYTVSVPHSVIQSRVEEGVMLFLNKNRTLSLVLNFIFLIILISSNAQADERNINKLLNNQVVVSRQIMCILGKSECDQLGLQLKGMIKIKATPFSFRIMLKIKNIFIN